MTDPWAAALEAAAAAAVTVVIGPSDAGKTSLVARLAGALVAAGEVAVVDADLGQSVVGPPTTVGLARLSAPAADLARAPLAGLEFLGVTSPVPCLRATAAATRRLVERARAAGAARVLVDTSGLVDGEVGRALKRMKIDAVAPDLLLVLQRADECEAVALHYAAAGLRVLRLPAARARRRSAEARRRYREHALAAHLAAAVPVTLELARVPARPAAGARGLVVGALDDVLVGLDDERGDTVGLGRVCALDVNAATLTVETTVGAARIAAVTIGRERFRPAA